MMLKFLLITLFIYSEIFANSLTSSSISYKKDKSIYCNDKYNVFCENENRERKLLVRESKLLDIKIEKPHSNVKVTPNVQSINTFPSDLLNNSRLTYSISESIEYYLQPNNVGLGLKY